MIGKKVGGTADDLYGQVSEELSPRNKISILYLVDYSPLE